MNTGHECRKCRCPVREYNLVRLWDGQSYCRECIERACPGLSEHSIIHSSLQESKPFRLKNSLTSGMFYVLMMSIICATLFMISGIDRFVLYAAATTLVVVTAVGIACWIPLFVLCDAWLFRPRIKVEKGRLWPGNCIFGKCRWLRLSKPSNWFDRVLALRLSQRPSVRILASGWSLRRLVHYDVGYSSEMESIWVGFLTLALGPAINEPGRV